MKYIVDLLAVDGETHATIQTNCSQMAMKALRAIDHEGSSISMTYRESGNLTDAGVDIDGAQDVYALLLGSGGKTAVADAPRITIVNEKRRGAAVFVFRDGLVLTCQRIACRDMNGLWQIAGGAVEPHESIYQAASRELAEEMGCLKHPMNLVYLCDMTALTPDGHPFWTSFFRCDVNAAFVPENKEPERHGDWEWVEISELLKRPLIPGVSLVLEKFKDEI